MTRWPDDSMTQFLEAQLAFVDHLLRLEIDVDPIHCGHPPDLEPEFLVLGADDRLTAYHAREDECCSRKHLAWSIVLLQIDSFVFFVSSCCSFKT